MDNEAEDQNTEDQENTTETEDSSEETTDSQGQQDSNTSDKSGDESGGKSDPDKPAWMSDRIWEENFKGKDKTPEETAEFFAKRYGDAEKMIKQRRDVLTDEIREELQTERFANRPEAPTDYGVPKFEFGDDNTMEITVESDDPYLLQFQAFAHEQGYSQEQFDGLLEMHYEAALTLFPNWEDEKEKIGEFAEERAGYVNTWLSKVLSPDSYKAMESKVLTAGELVAMEELMELTGNVKFQNDSTKPAGTGLSKAELMELMNSDAYFNGDPAVLQKVQAGWKKLTG